MKMTLMLVILMGSVMRLLGQVTERPAGFRKPVGLPSIYEIRQLSIDGKMIGLDRYRGKKILVVNVASECGYTGQYEDLQRLHEAYSDRVAVLGVPSNQFGKQEPGSNEDIKTFCSDHYKVTFPLFGKTDVKGADQCPLYRWLTDPAANGWNDKEPGWNFYKYLVDENGDLLAVYSSRVKPMDEAIISKIK